MVDEMGAELAVQSAGVKVVPMVVTSVAPKEALWVARRAVKTVASTVAQWVARTAMMKDATMAASTVAASVKTSELLLAVRMEVRLVELMVES